MKSEKQSEDKVVRKSRVICKEVVTGALRMGNFDEKDTVGTEGCIGS